MRCDAMKYAYMLARDVPGYEDSGEADAGADNAQGRCSGKFGLQGYTYAHTDRGI